MIAAMVVLFGIAVIIAVTIIVMFSVLQNRSAYSAPEMPKRDEVSCENDLIDVDGKIDDIEKNPRSGDRTG